MDSLISSSWKPLEVAHLPHLTGEINVLLRMTQLITAESKICTQMGNSTLTMAPLH